MYVYKCAMSPALSKASKTLPHSFAWYVLIGNIRLVYVHSNLCSLNQSHCSFTQFSKIGHILFDKLCFTYMQNACLRWHGLGHGRILLYNSRVCAIRTTSVFEGLIFIYIAVHVSIADHTFCCMAKN